jgi:adenine-specific DNA-methyltransferase
MLNREDGGNRKYILVDMGGFFDTVTKPRIEKTMYASNWKDGQPRNNFGYSHMFKYMYLEQYEDTLNNVLFKSLDRTVQETLDSFGDYFVRYMLDYETRDSPTRLMLDKFQTPFDYKIKISRTGDEEEYATVDLVETFNYLLGLWVEKLRVFKDREQTYQVVFGKKGNDTVVVIWRNTKDLDLEQDKKFIEETILSGKEPDTIYINGDSYVKNAQPIEPEFKRLMGA